MASSGVGDVFKKKGKKGKKGVKGYNLNLDSGIPKAEEVAKTTVHNDILDGVEAAEDDGWADMVEKKRVVATGGKQVTELIDMSELMTADETIARKLEKEDIKQAFHGARTVKPVVAEEPSVVEEKKDGKKDETGTKLKNIFGGGVGGVTGLGWRENMRLQKMKQRESELSVDNATAFPSLADAMSSAGKPKETAQPPTNPWGRGNARSAALAAISAALRPDEPEGGETTAGAKEVKEVSKSETTVTDVTPLPESAPVESQDKAEAEGVQQGGEKVDGPSGGEEVKGEATAIPGVGEEVKQDGVSAGVSTEEEKPVMEVDTEGLKKQFGNKKKKKKKPTEEQS